MASDSKTHDPAAHMTVLPPLAPAPKSAAELLDRVPAVVAAGPASASVRLGYGTAGFRTKAELLPAAVLRMGFLSVLRSLQLQQEIGVMVTASHNPVADNGLKMCDPDGGMLAQTWEGYAQDVANAVQPEAVVEALKRVIDAERINITGKPTVVVGRDTRPSSESLCALVIQGARAVGATVIDIGLVTTPQLHHVVRMRNQKITEWASVPGYYSMLGTGYIGVVSGLDASVLDRSPLIIDCAHGIGAATIEPANAALSGLVTLEARNTGDGQLNHEVGAEHAQKARLPPAGFDPRADANKRLASFDGDADRLVYHYFDDEGRWHLLDGDAIAALCATFFAEMLTAMGWKFRESDAGHPNFVSFGVVQTAYANGASTRYIKERVGVPVGIAKTGVKFVHHKAAHYDIGIYFEANGHGTVLFSDRLLRRLDAYTPPAGNDAAAAAHSRLKAATIVVNQAVGDALSDALLCEAILTYKRWTVQDWARCYSDLPSRQTKLPVKDRSYVSVTEDETRVISPVELQNAIDAAVAAIPQGRAFCRPSGTEDVVRVYAEADTQENADKLAGQVAIAVHTHARGVGAPPDPTRFVA